VGQVRADVVYDNGPINGTIGADAIWTTWAVSDSFAVTSPTILTGAQDVGIWCYGSGIPITVNWSVGTTPFASDVGTGTANVASTYIGDVFNNYKLYNSSFPLSCVVTVGTYWLSLTDGTNTAFSTGTYWDINGGASLAYQNGPGYPSYEPRPSHSFQITGSPVPEPSTLIMLLGGLGIAVARWRRQWKVT
jgi:hypothetical protein